MTTTSTAPSRSATATLRMATSMKSAWRKFSVSIFTPGGQRLGEAGEQAVDLAGEREGVGVRLLLDGEDDRRLRLVRGGAALGLGALADRRRRRPR